MKNHPGKESEQFIEIRLFQLKNRKICKSVATLPQNRNLGSVPPFLPVYKVTG